MSLIPSFFGRRSDVFDPFSVDPWDPFEGFPFSDLGPLTASFRRPLAATSSLLDASLTPFAQARFDWKETPSAHVFKADLPGLGKDEVKVEVEDDRVLQISGERSREQEETTDTWHRVERSSGKFTRRFRLPQNAQLDHVKAAMENGVLTVTIPKIQEDDKSKKNVKSIKISG